MNFRTDLAMEIKESLKKDNLDGILTHSEQVGNIKITRIKIVNENGERLLKRPVGTYITVEIPDINISNILENESRCIIKNELIKILPKSGCILIAGIGNAKITHDSLGPRCVEKIISTRHLHTGAKCHAKFADIRPCACIKTGVLGQTGIETGETISGYVKAIKPCAVIVIDSLASKDISRLGTTIQISSGGIIPGSGVGVARQEISEKTLNVPVISIGVPTVTDFKYFLQSAYNGTNDLKGYNQSNSNDFMITSKNIDLTVERCCNLISCAINDIIQKI